MSPLCGLQVMGEYSALTRERALLQDWKAQGELGIHPNVSIPGLRALPFLCWLELCIQALLYRVSPK